MWCWGKDIMSEEGNLLIDFGFKMQKSTDPANRGTRYILDIDDERRLTLMALGMVYSEEGKGAAQFERSRYIPLFNPDPNCNKNIYSFKELEGFGPAKSEPDKQFLKRSKAECALLISHYETWIIQIANKNHQKKRVSTWVKPILSSSGFANMWFEIYQNFNRIYSQNEISSQTLQYS